MRRPLIVLAAVSFLSLLVCPSLAGAIPKIAVHVQTPVAKGACTTAAPDRRCSEFQTEGLLATPSAVYFIAAHGPSGGIEKASFGVSYDSDLSVKAWTSCADLDFAGNRWPGSESWITLTFAECRSDDYGEGTQAVLGFLYVYAYAPSSLAVTAQNGGVDPPLKRASVVECSGFDTYLSAEEVGVASFGEGRGCNPCLEPCPGDPDAVDVIPPVLQSVRGAVGRKTILLTFDEPLGAGADDPGNYLVSPAVSITEVAVSAADVTLGLDFPLEAETTYTVAVENVEDLSGNPVGRGTQGSFHTGSAVTSPRIALHVQGSTVKGVCDTQAPNYPCSQFNTHGELKTGSYIYFVVAGGAEDGVGGAAFGVSYDDGNLFVGDSFNCAGIFLPQHGWPAPDSDIAMTVIPCQDEDYGEGVQAVLGGLYVYAYDDVVFRLTERKKASPGDPSRMQVESCSVVDTDLTPDQAGWIGFGTDGGCNPCLGPCVAQTAVTPVSWGGIKRSFGLSKPAPGGGEE